jgi:hypothetical protein
LIAGGGLFITLLGLLLPRDGGDARAPVASAEAARANGDAEASGASRHRFVRAGRAQGVSRPEPTAAEVVAGKVSQFARSRREILHALAARYKTTPTPDMLRFFDAVEAGLWDEARALFETLKARQRSEEIPVEQRRLWPAILETIGVAEAAREWPAQALLDYGQAVLGALKPGMVYVGGTDAGRFIPTLLNETSDGERHLVLTQNALADGTYLDYLEFLHADRLKTLTKDDSQRAFRDYLDDATRRLKHDQEFPDEPRQLRPGEDVRIIDHRVQVSGQVAVMSINERLLQTLMQKNPDVPFAMEESFSLPSTYAGAAPLGPLLELRAGEASGAFTAAEAAQSLDAWRMAAQRLQDSPDAQSDAPKAYAQMAVAQGNLFAHHGLAVEAEEAWRLAAQMAPSHLAPVERLSQFLVEGGRAAEAQRVLEDFARNNPGQRADVDKLRSRLPAP